MNKDTVEYYNKNAAEYAQSTINLDISDLHKEFTKDIQAGGKILDAGCGSGRDLLAFKNLGFNVQGIDASAELVEIAKKNAGVPVEHKSFSDIKWKAEFDGVWCMASLLHLKKDELKEALGNIAESMKEGSKIYASFKAGEGESVDPKGRFFSYYSIPELSKIIEESKVFGDVKLYHGADAQGREDTQWISLSAKREMPKPKNESRRKFKM
jgi:SAM-dependent methyltransferase